QKLECEVDQDDGRGEQTVAWSRGRVEHDACSEENPAAPRQAIECQPHRRQKERKVEGVVAHGPAFVRFAIGTISDPTSDCQSERPPAWVEQRVHPAPIVRRLPAIFGPLLKLWASDIRGFKALALRQLLERA